MVRCLLLILFTFITSAESAFSAMTSNNYNIEVFGVGEVGSVMQSNNFSITLLYDLSADGSEEERVGGQVEIVQKGVNETSSSRSRRVMSREKQLKEEDLSGVLNEYPLLFDSLSEISDKLSSVSMADLSASKDMIVPVLLDNFDEVEIKGSGDSASEDLKKEEDLLEVVVVEIKNVEQDVRFDKKDRLGILVLSLILLYIFFRFTKVGKRYAFV